MRTAGDLDSGVRSLRMIPFAEAGQCLERTVRDLALAAGSREIVALHPPDQREPYTSEVHHRIRREFRDADCLARCIPNRELANSQPAMRGLLDSRRKHFEFVAGFAQQLAAPR